jgi:hypothetical protein
VTVDRHGGVGLVPGEHQADGLACRLERRVVEAALGVDRRETGRRQQHVALPQRDRHLLGQPEQHLATWLGPAGLQEAEMASRDVGLVRQGQLAEAAALAPGAQQVADVWGRGNHGPNDRGVGFSRP